MTIQIHKSIIYENAPLDFRIESRFLKVPGETRDFNWSLMWSFDTLDEALAMITSLRKGEGDNPIEEYRLTQKGNAFLFN